MVRNSFSEYLPSFLNLISGIGVLVVSFLVELRFQASVQMAKRAGIVLVSIGMLLVIWAAFHLRGAFLGEVEPTRNDLVRSGPYKYIRHPVYLGMTIALMGVSISLRSWLGLLVAFAAFLPSEIYRARLEEKALWKMHGSEWEEYAQETGFLVPYL